MKAVFTKLGGMGGSQQVGVISNIVLERIQEIFECNFDTSVQIFVRIDDDLLTGRDKIELYHIVGIELNMFPEVRIFFKIPEHNAEFSRVIDLSDIENLKNPNII